MVILMLSIQRIQGCKVSLSQLSSSAARTQAIAVSMYCSPGFSLLARITIKPPDPVASGHTRSCGRSTGSRELRCLPWGRSPTNFTPVPFCPYPGSHHGSSVRCRRSPLVGGRIKCFHRGADRARCT